jgi:hypothetical protein
MVHLFLTRKEGFEVLAMLAPVLFWQH